MGKHEDFTGRKIGMLTVLGEADARYQSGHRVIYWKCQCDCGNVIERFSGSLRRKSEIPLNCGCYTRSLNLINLVGQRFGKLVVLERAANRVISGHSYAYWKCQCDCGNIVEVRAGSLTHKSAPITKSCGCFRIQDLTGQKFGMLTVVGKVEGKGRTRWLCKCDCGNTATILAKSLLNGTKRSCGCLFPKTSKKTMEATHKEKIQQRSDAYGVSGTMVCYMNNKLYSTNTSGYKGVTFEKNRWVARICFKRKTIHLGRYEKIEDAIAARKKGEEMYFKPVLEEWAKDNPDRAGKMQGRIEKKFRTQKDN